MSAVIKTATPFIIKSVLFAALEKVKAEPKIVTNDEFISISRRNQIQVGDILTNRKDYNGRQFFRKQGEQWVFLHDKDEYSTGIVSQLVGRRYTPVSRFLSDLTQSYGTCYQEHLEVIAEQDRIRLENERKERVEATRVKAIAKAKAQGYSVKESQTAAGQIQLVLTRTV